MKIKDTKNIIIIVVLSILAGCLDFIYFYRVSNDYYLADIAPHIDAAKAVLKLEPIVLQTKRVSTVGYPLFHVLTGIFSVFLNSNYRISGALVLTLFKISVFIVCIFMYKRLCNDNNEKKDYKVITIISILGLSYISTLPFTGKLYLPQGSPNVWHNPTYIAMQPFALLMFYYAYKCTESKITERSNYIGFALTSIMTCISKPSYIVVVIPAMCIYFLCEYIITRKIYIKNILIISLSLIPTFIILVIQYFVTFSDSVSTGIRFGTFLNLSLAEALVATISVVLYPLLYATSVKFKFYNPKFVLLSVCSFIVGWIQYYFFYEKENADGNFAWGYFMSIFVLYFATYIDYKGNENKLKIVKYIYIVQVFWGIVYFGRLVTKHFYI